MTVNIGTERQAIDNYRKQTKITKEKNDQKDRKGQSNICIVEFLIKGTELII